MVHNVLARGPEVTPAPLPELVHRRLGIRQASTVETCGYGTSLPGLGDGIRTAHLAITCDPGFFCAHNDASSLEGCCSNTNDCTMVSTCLDRTAYLALTTTFGFGTAACTDQADAYCAEVRYNNGYSTFICATTPNDIEGGILGATLPAALSTQPTLSSAFQKAVSPTTIVVPAPSQTSQTPAPASSGGSSLGTGAIVGIAIAGAVVILGAFALIFFMRRASQKKQDSSLREANVLRQTIHQQQQQMSANASHPSAPNSHVQSWMHGVQEGPKEPPAHDVTEYYDYTNNGGTMYNDVSTVVDGTVAGTVDHNHAPRF